MIWKLIVGIATCFAVVWLLFFATYLLIVFLTSWKPTDDELGPILIVHFGCVMLLIGLVLYYVRHVVRNESVTAETKAFWIKAILLGGIVSMPIYCRAIASNLDQVLL
ncbi:MAG: hypothetical protein AB7O68_22850 [Pirellulales bacterium]